MQAMGNLSHKHKLTARTSAEVVEGARCAGGLAVRRRGTVPKKIPTTAEWEPARPVQQG